MTFWELFFPVAPDISMAAFMGTTAWLLGGKKKDKVQMITTVISNYMISIYLTELISEMSGLKSHIGIAFLVAFGGLKFIEKTIEQIFERISTLNKDEDEGADSNTK